jgi:aldehyde dehydrogenase (NAD+)
MIILSLVHLTEVIEAANNTTYGLASSVLTENLSRAFRVANQLEAGSTCVRRHHFVNCIPLILILMQVNCVFALEGCMPFVGHKQSGIGGDYGQYALDMFVVIIVIQY